MRYRMWLAVACAAWLASPSLARVVEDWPYERLFKEADLVVIATAVSSKDTRDTFIDKRWPLDFVGQSTTFDVLQVVKGKYTEKKLDILHFKFGKRRDKETGPVLIRDGPTFVNFPTEPAEVKVGGVFFDKSKIEYMLFLKKAADGRYEPVSGRIDPDFSVRELFPPTFSRGE